MVCTAPSVKVTPGVPHAAEAEAMPKAAVISVEEGLHPRVGTAPVIIIVGGLGALIQFTVLVIVAVLPQASIAVNVLVCDAEQEVVATAPSVNDIVTAPQASVAVALPNDPAISVGLHPSVTSA